MIDKHMQTRNDADDEPTTCKVIHVERREVHSMMDFARGKKMEMRQIPAAVECEAFPPLLWG